MHSLFTRARALAYQRRYSGQAQLATFRPAAPRPLSRAARLACMLLTVALAPLLLIAFLLLGERRA